MTKVIKCSSDKQRGSFSLSSKFSPDEKIFVSLKLKAFADDKFNVPRIMESVCKRV